MKLLKFSTWARTFGVNNLANECGVGAHQVRTWLRGQALPRHQSLKKIIELSNNKLKLEELVQETTRAK